MADYEQARYHQCTSCHRLTELEEGTALLYCWDGDNLKYSHLHIVCESCGAVNALFNVDNPDMLLEVAQYFGLPIVSPETVDKRTRKAYEYLYGEQKKPKKPQKPKELPAPEPYDMLVGFWRYLLETRNIHRELDIPEI